MSALRALLDKYKVTPADRVMLVVSVIELAGTCQEKGRTRLGDLCEDLFGWTSDRTFRVIGGLVRRGTLAPRLDGTLPGSRKAGG